MFVCFSVSMHPMGGEDADFGLLRTRVALVRRLWTLEDSFIVALRTRLSLEDSFILALAPPCLKCVCECDGSAARACYKSLLLQMLSNAT